MTKAYDELKKIRKEKKKITEKDIAKAEKEHGDLKDEERVELEAESLKADSKKRAGAKITLEQYLEATKALDKAKEGSAEYKKAEKIVDAFESAA